MEKGRITIIVEDEKISVPREVLHKSAYLVELLEFQGGGDILVIENIEPFTFKIIMSILVGNTVISELINMCDFLRISEKIDLFKEYYCKIDDCNGISLCNTFCPLHKCGLENCKNIRYCEKYSSYCINHTCVTSLCRQFVNNKGFYDKHRCTVDGCKHWKRKESFCFSHRCRKCFKRAITNNLCDDHK